MSVGVIEPGGSGGNETALDRSRTDTAGCRSRLVMSTVKPSCVADSKHNHGLPTHSICSAICRRVMGYDDESRARLATNSTETRKVGKRIDSHMYLSQCLVCLGRSTIAGNVGMNLLHVSERGCFPEDRHLRDRAAA